MIPELRDDAIIKKVGGRFKLTALIQRRWLQLLQGARPMIDTEGLTTMEVVVKEISEGLIIAKTPKKSEPEDDIL
ncbi:MAG: DNA-directed RNA polymerase subunit omega [Planctomycetes bacterium]|nr:DNA-directed RNA polymerase subunit omega [Planctomycetota bacterium]